MNMEINFTCLNEAFFCLLSDPRLKASFWLNHFSAHVPIRTKWKAGKSQRLECIQTTSNLNKSIRQFLHLNALNHLPFVPSKTDVSCLSFRSFCFQVTWLTKYGHDYRKWWEPQIEETWPKTNPRIQRELKIWRLEVTIVTIFRNFVV